MIKINMDPYRLEGLARTAESIEYAATAKEALSGGRIGTHIDHQKVGGDIEVTDSHPYKRLG